MIINNATIEIITARTLNLFDLKQFINIWFIKKINSQRLPDHLVVLFSLLLIFLWPLIPHQSFYNNWLNVIVFLPIGFILYFLKQSQVTK